MATDDAMTSAEPGGSPESRRTWLHHVDRLAEPLWPAGVVAAVLAMVALRLNAQGESLEWGVYMALGFSLPPVIIGVWLLDRLQAGSLVAISFRLAFALVAISAMLRIWWTYSFPSTFVAAPVLGACSALPYLFRKGARSRSMGQRFGLAFLAFWMSAIAWLAAARMLHWTSINKWVTNSPYSFGVACTVLLLVTTVLFWRPSIPVHPIPRWCGHLAALAIFTWFAIRTDAFFMTTSIHHWGFWIGPIESVRDGGWLLWDVPSQYGFLSILTVALMPIASAWQAVYVLQIILLLLVSFALYLMLRSWRPGVANYLFSVLVTVAAVYFMSGMVKDLSGPQPWLSVGAMRFFWCHASLVAAWWFLMRAKPAPMRYLVCGSCVWLLGVLWSSESAVYATSVFASASVVLCLQAMTAAYRNRGTWMAVSRAALPYILIPAGLLASAMLAIEAYYRFYLGHGPDWFALIEFAASYSDGFGSIAVNLTDPVWVLVILFSLASLAAAWQLRQNPMAPRLAALAGVWGAVWTTASYYVSRSHPNNVNNLAPVFCMAIAMLIPVLKTYAPRPVVHAARHAVLPLLFVVLCAPFGHPSFPLLFKKPQPNRTHVEAILPPLDESARTLLESAGAKPDDPLACNYKSALLPMPLSVDQATGKTQFFEHTWLPQPIIMLIVLPPQRRAVYLDRCMERWQRSGWLLVARSYKSFDDALRQRIATHYDIREVKGNREWRLFWCQYRGKPKGTAP